MTRRQPFVLLAMLCCLLTVGCAGQMSAQSPPIVWAFTISYQGSGVEYTSRPTVRKAAMAAGKGLEVDGGCPIIQR